MGRWVGRIRDRERRGWMFPGPPWARFSETRSGEPGGPAVSTRTYRTPWARGPRAPLRRNQGVPLPLETPLYLHRAALSQARARRRAVTRIVAWSVAATLLGLAVGLLAFAG